MTGSPVRVVIVASHPVQYASPQFRTYAEDDRLDLTIAYCSMRGAERTLDPDFGVEIAWDIPLLEGYRWVDVPDRSPWPRSARSFALVNPGLWSLIRTRRFDVVACLTGYRSASFWIAAAAAKASRSAFLSSTDAHSLQSRGDSRWDGPWRRALKRTAVGSTFRASDGVLVPSTGSAEFVRSLGVSADRVHLTPYVIDTEFFAARAARVDRGTVRRGWSVPADAPVALFVGKLAPWKRPLDLLDAAAEVEGLYVVYVGDGELRGALQRRVHALQMDDRVRILGFVNQSELPAAYAAADTLILPSEYEPFGLVVNEAFACGLPAVVSTACGAARDLVHDGLTGFRFPPGDVTSLRMLLQRLADDTALRASLGRGARERLDTWGLLQNLEGFVAACQAVRGRPHG